MQIRIDVQGADAAASALMQFAAGIKSKTPAAVAQGGKLVEADAKAMAPVDTGALRASITSKPAGMRCDIGTNVEYAIYQEFGTYKMAAHPFLVPALKGNEQAIIELIAAAISG